MIYFVADYNVDGVASISADSALHYLKDKKALCIDIETTPKFKKGSYDETVYEGGLDPYLSKTIMLQIGTPEKVFVIDTRCVDITQFKDILENPEALKIGHNLKFEAKHLYMSKISLNNIWDTMLVDLCLYNGLQFKSSLEDLAWRYLKIKTKDATLFSDAKKGLKKSLRTQFSTIGDKPFSKELIEYGAEDVIIPLKIYDIQLQGRNLKEGNWLPKQLIDLENEFCLVLADIELAGMPFDVEHHTKLIKDNVEIYDRRIKALNDYVFKTYPTYRNTGFFGDTISLEWTSPKQVVELFKKIGSCPQEKSKSTKKIEYTVSATALLKTLPIDLKQKYEKDTEVEIIDFNTLVLMYLLFKVSEQLMTTFGLDYQKNIHPITGRIHSDYWQMVNTGRISSRHPNLQNWPSDEQFRKCFHTKGERKFILADYSGQELRITADKSKEQSMIDFFNNGHPLFGDDFHAYVATKMFQIMWKDKNLVITKDTYPKERNAAKSLNFKIIYGGTAHTLKYDFDVDEETAEEFIDTYYSALPSVKKYFSQVEKNALELGYIKIDNIGRRWFNPLFEDAITYKDMAESHYPKDFKYWQQQQKDEFKAELKKTHPEVLTYWQKYFNIVRKSDRSARNYPIQGTGGSMTKFAAVLYRREILKSGLRWGAPIVNLVHDEVIVELRKEVDNVDKLLENCMTLAGSHFCKSVEMRASAVISNYWKH